MPKASLGEQELALLRFVAERGGGTVGEVAEDYGERHGLARSTVLTVMERLRKKGYLRRRSDDGVFRYQSTSEPRELLKEVVGSFVRGPLAGDVSPFVAYLAESGELSPRELKQLEQLASRLEARAKKEEGE